MGSHRAANEAPPRRAKEGVRMFRRRWTVLAATALLLTALPAPARASGDWRWPVSGDVVLAYGSSYAGASGKTCTHGGVDIGADAGTTVRACCGGEVTFAGRVPAGEGAQAFAVTVLTSDGLRVTYLPLRSACVAKGESVSAASTLGVLDGSGDASSAGAHLHLSVSRGGTKLDPESFLGAAQSAPPAPDPEPAPAPATKPTPAPAAPKPAPARLDASAPANVRVSAPSHVAQSNSSAAPARASAAAPAPLQQALSGALRDPRGLGSAPTLTRVQPVANPTVLDVERMVADLRSGQGVVTSWMLRLALVALGAACVVPVLRSARAAGAAKAVEPAVVRRSVR
jgi:hypothetical protein